MIQNRVKEQYKELCTRVGLPKTIVVTTELVESFKATQQKGKRSPIHLQERVEQKIQKFERAKSCKKDGEKQRNAIY